MLFRLDMRSRRTWDLGLDHGVWGRMSMVPAARATCLGLIAVLTMALTPARVIGGTLEVLYGDRWKVLETEILNGREFIAITGVAEVAGGKIRDAGEEGVELLIDKVRFTLKTRTVSVTQGDTTFLLSTAPIKIGRTLYVPIDFLLRALEARYGNGRVYWNRTTRVVWVGSQSYTVRLLRHHSYPEYTRIVLETTKPLDYTLRETSEDQLTLRVKGGVLSPMLAEPLKISDGIVQVVEPVQGEQEAIIRIRRDRFAGFTRVFALKNPDRIVLDLYKEKGVGRSRQAQERPLQPAPRVPSPPPPVAAIRTIVIDPGHGGRDAGAVGPRGLKEKDVVLDISLRLRQLIQERLGIRVVMTRTEDVFVPLEERTAIANRAKADFFISIHVNAADRSRAQGFETYYLSRQPSDSTARASAIRENLSVNLEGLQPKEQNSLKAILWDMANTLYIKESSELAEMLLDELDEILQVENRGVKSAPFFVLMGAAMPAVLAEVAFISNPFEERKLRGESYRDRVADALFTGVKRFKVRYERRLGVVPAMAPVQ